MKRKMLCMLVAAVLTLQVFMGASAAGGPIVVESIEKYGNIVLSVSGSDFLEMGYDYGDIVTVSIGESTLDMPVGSSYSDVDHGDAVCRVVMDAESGTDQVKLAINMGDLATALGLAEKKQIQQEPGYCWEYRQGLKTPVPVSFTMKKAGGYLQQYMIRQLVFTNERSDYVQLSDEAFANFRMIHAPDLAEGRLYRSSSPIDPALGRNTYADAALKDAGIRTVINLADSAEGMRAHAGWEGSHYATLNSIGLNLEVDFLAESFCRGLAKGLRFMMEKEGPYLVHCTHGRDRAGFVSALLACLMGADADSVIEDYMITYTNYNAVQKGTRQYEEIARNNIVKTLCAAFDVEELDAAETDLAAQARDYLREALQLTDEEISLLMEKLGK